MRIGGIERGEVVPWHLLLRPVRVLVLLTCMMVAQTRLKVRK